MQCKSEDNGGISGRLVWGLRRFFHDILQRFSFRNIHDAIEHCRSFLRIVGTKETTKLRKVMDPNPRSQFKFIILSLGRMENVNTLTNPGLMDIILISLCLRIRCLEVFSSIEYGSQSHWCLREKFKP